MYAHTKSYGTEIIPPEETRGESTVAGFALYLILIINYLDEFIEGLKHFAVSDVKFHPQRYVLGP